MGGVCAKVGAGSSCVEFNAKAKPIKATTAVEVYLNTAAAVLDLMTWECYLHCANSTQAPTEMASRDKHIRIKRMDERSSR
jgi:hypothetical protein